jgi:hypothetical protein
MNPTKREFNILLLIMAASMCMMMVFGTLWMVQRTQEESAGKQVEKLKADLRVAVNKYYTLQEQQQEETDAAHQAEGVAKWQLAEATTQLAACKSGLGIKR